MNKQNWSVTCALRDFKARSAEAIPDNTAKNEVAILLTHENENFIRVYHDGECWTQGTEEMAYVFVYLQDGARQMLKGKPPGWMTS